MTLYHYTCRDHGQPGIDADHRIRPHPHPWLPEPLVWLTDLDVPHREALGLTSRLLGCDRTAVRYRIDAAAEAACIPWHVYARRLPPGLRHRFELIPGSMPRHWWVAQQPLPIVANTAATEAAR